MADEADHEAEQRPLKRRRTTHTAQQDGPLGQGGQEEELGEAEGKADGGEAIGHILYVRWFGAQGQTKLNKLPLRHLGNINELEELPSSLVGSQYPSSERLPDYFTNTAFVRFTPEVECLALPGDVVRTELRLVMCYQGWEYTVLRQDTTHRDLGPEQTIHLMTTEFSGSDPIMAALGLRVSLIAYPVVALRKAFLEDLHGRLLASPDTFKGML